MPDKIKEIKVFRYPNATVRVEIPELSEEEHNRRMKILHDSAAALLKEAERKGREDAKLCV